MDDSERIDTVLGGVARAPARTPAPVLPVGTLLGDGRYTIQKLLGRGGMGSVFEAHDAVLAKDVALKLIDPRIADLERVRDEVRLAHEVTHPNVCRTYDLEQLDGHWIVKMELVAGSTLGQQVAGRSVAIAEVVAIARQLAAGLQAAHERGVVHRDLKPQNILVEAATGRVVITDFGLARRDTEPADAAGTPAYMAPEQARGDAVDGRADLYAFGCVLYLLLTGDVVFAAETPTKLMQRHAGDAVPDVRARRPDTPLWLAQLVRRLLAKDPAARPNDADVAHMLVPKRRRFAIAIVLVALVGVGGMALALPRTTTPVTSWQPAIRNLDEAFEDYATGPAWSPDGASIAFASNRTGGSRIFVEPAAGGEARPISPRELQVWIPRWTGDGSAVLVTDDSEGDIGEAFRIPVAGGAPQKLGRVAWPDDCRRGRIAFARDDPSVGMSLLIVRESDGHERTITRTAGPIVHVRCDRTGERVTYTLATGRLSGTLWVIPVAGGVPRLLAPFAMFGAFAPDGASIVATASIGGTQNLWELPLDGRRAQQITFGAGPDLAPDVSPDGRQVVFTRGAPDWTNLRIYAYGVPGGVAHKLTSQVEVLADLAMDPDGSQLVAQVARGNDSRLVRISTTDGSEQPMFPGQAPAITPDGRTLVYALPGTGSVYARSIGDGPARLVATVPASVDRITIDARGVAHLVAFADPDRGGIHTWIAPVTGGAPTLEMPRAVIAPPVGDWRVEVERAGTAFEARVLAPGMAYDDRRARVVHVVSANAAWTTDGTGFVYVGSDAMVHLLDVATGDDRALVAVDGFDQNTTRLAPDGKTVYVVQSVARTTMHVVSNFGDRPR